MERTDWKKGEAMLAGIINGMILNGFQQIAGSSCNEFSADVLNSLKRHSSALVDLSEVLNMPPDHVRDDDDSSSDEIP